MGRKKFDKSKAVTFRLQYRSADDPAYSEGGLLSDRIFAVVDPVKSKEHKSDPQLRERILKRFSDRDLGIIDEKTARQIKKEKLLKQKEEQERGGLGDLPPEIASKIKDRDDLWITHLNRMKVNQELAEIEEEERLEKLAAKKKKQKISKADDDDEEWEDDDEDGEWEDEDEEEWEDDEEGNDELEDEEFEVEEIEMDEEEYKTLMKDEPPQLIDASKFEEIKSKVSETQVSKSTNKKTILSPDEDIDLKSVQLAPGVKTKRYDENGLPLDGYDYYQHIADPTKGGAPDFVFVAEYKETPKLAKDIDINPDELTPEQREVFEALENDEDGAYEELEDNFIDMLTGGEAAVILEPETKSKPTKKKEEETMEISYDKSELSQPKKNVKFAEVQKESKTVQQPSKGVVQSKKELARAFREKAEALRQKFIETRVIAGKSVKPQGSLLRQQQIEEEEDIEEIEDEEGYDPEAPVETLTEEGRIDFREDIAMQQVLNKESTDDEGDEEAEEDDKDEVETVASRSFYQGPTPILSIIKEDNAKKPKKNDRKSSEVTEKDGEQAGDDKESEEEENEAQNESVIDKVFTKRRKGETKEEKKARKQMIKEFKNERRHKKAEFKTLFDNEKKKNLEKVERQAGASNPRGFSVYKL